jgi:hypothetical protein
LRHGRRPFSRHSRVAMVKSSLIYSS